MWDAFKSKDKIGISNHEKQIILANSINKEAETPIEEN